MFIPPISWMLKSMNGLHLQGHLEQNYTALHLMLDFSFWESFPGRAFLNKDEVQNFPRLAKLCNDLGFRHLTGYANTNKTASFKE